MKNKYLGAAFSIMFIIFSVVAVCLIILLSVAVYSLTSENKKLTNEIDYLREQITEQAEEVSDLKVALKTELEKQVIDINTLVPGTIIMEEDVKRDKLDQYFLINEIPTDVFERINGKSYRENDNIGLDELRYIKLIHYNYEHKIQIGELIVNAALASDFVDIFRELFENEYEIYSMYLVDNYWTGDGGDSDTASIDVNNTSAFNYRWSTGSTSELSNHAFGCAIDINPQQNPYVSYRSGTPSWSHENANDYIDRDTGYEHVITHDDLCYKLFIEHGFTWGGDWDVIKDYQHFEKKIK